jgi:2,6-dihydroxypyridine 3-monooxygenase
LIAQERPCRYRLTSFHTLHRLLLAAFGHAGYHLGRELVGFDRDADRVVAQFASGHTAACDLLVCAYGIQSTARRLLLPQVTPRYAGYVGWRGTVLHADRRDAFGLLREAITYFVMPHSHILVYPIPGTRGAPHQAPLNWVWYRNVPEGQQLAELLADRGGTLRVGVAGARAGAARSSTAAAGHRSSVPPAATGCPSVRDSGAVLAGGVRHRGATHGIRTSVPDR